MKKIITILAMLGLGLANLATPVMAASPLNSYGDALGSDNAAILKNCADDSNGILCILNLVVDIMTIGVGILGVVSISIVGIQYLTAGDSEEKVRTAKRRLFEIIIGLAAYAIIYALLKWLLPSFG